MQEENKSSQQGAISVQVDATAKGAQVAETAPVAVLSPALLSELVGARANQSGNDEPAG